MTAQHTIMRNLADAFAASSAVKAAALAQSGRACLVQLDAYGAAGLPGEADAPFLLAYADGELELGAEVAEETFECLLVAGVRSQAEGGVDRTDVSPRTAAANGLTVYGNAAAAEALLDAALAVVRAGSFGAVFRKAAVTASGTLDFPLQWARARLSFYTPQTF